jgi:signal transduction histidine kinase
MAGPHYGHVRRVQVTALRSHPERGGAGPLRRLAGTLNPRRWGFPARSAAVSATVVFVALTVAGVGLIAVLYHSLLRGVDDVTAGRVRDLVADLEDDDPNVIEGSQLQTNGRVAMVQVVARDGKVLVRSDSAPSTPLVPFADVTATLRSGIELGSYHGYEMRVSTQRATSAIGSFAVEVAGATERSASEATTVALLLAAAAPVVIGVAAAASYTLVTRSLRSVGAIRTRVEEISSSQLAERVPVPAHRDEIAALALTMNEMLSRIELGHTAQQRFIGDASHELRSPLATIITTLEVGEAHPELLVEELSGTLLPEAHRMQALLDDLLLLARADERGLTLRHEVVSLGALADDEITRLKRQTATDVHTDIAPANVMGDPGALLRVVRNLVENAARHARSRIDVEVGAQDGRSTLIVTDDGPGIPESERRRVFDRFVRLDSDRSREGGGTGLGLSIVAEIVAAHHGTIGVDEPPGGGTRVTVSFP